MTFIHSYLLLGLSLAALPVVLHLLMRQKPKQLKFPAFRFLRQKAFTNRRKLRLQAPTALLLPHGISRCSVWAWLGRGLSRNKSASAKKKRLPPC